MKHIYICSCDTDGGVYHYTLSDNKFHFQEKLPLDRPMYMVINGRRAYILLREIDSSTHFGGLVRCDIAGDGSLVNLSSPVSTGGIVPCHLCIDGDTVYTVNYLSGNIVKIPDKVVTHTGSGTDKSRQDAPHTHFVTLAPDGYVLCCDLGLDTVFTYDKALNETSRAAVPSGHGARHLEFSENGKRVYCVNEMGNSLTAFNYLNGQLKNPKTISLLPEFVGKSTAAAIRRIDNILYASHRGADCISRIILKEDGEARLLENTPCGGSSPRDIYIINDLLLCANEQTDNVTVFKLSNERPALTDDEINLKHPLCICATEII